MPNPTVISVSPNPSQNDVVLGINIVVTFSTLINTDTLSNFTFALSGRNLAEIVSPSEISERNPVPSLGTGYVLGTFSFSTANAGTQSVATFTPASPLRPGVTYTVIIVGKDSPSASTYVTDTSFPALPMLQSYQWTFTTGTLNINVPPVQNPIPSTSILDPNTIQIIPRAAIGNDLTQVIELIFPFPIDPTTFDLSSVLVGVEAVLGDPDVMVPTGTMASLSIAGNILRITVSGLF